MNKKNKKNTPPINLKKVSGGGSNQSTNANINISNIQAGRDAKVDAKLNIEQKYIENTSIDFF